ncbi:hypothetical protein M407DRAFT_31427 [Tulasnella calospora MUT 4182]|uniref:Uncharacterized protein n=1 Tax=Tulasnella calospora MUT 4182 TaxID=1051891 RepID=A0A0C3Q6H6_9AGAM|nr:hypothetical protein M407DRAFT_31427 [Tulasnella calospora MUT 4182]
MSGLTEASTASDIVFRGADGNECEAFVVAVRDFAFAKGLQKDRDWMLHFATTRLRGKALRWHAQLDLAIREDWDLFVQALFEQYPLVEEPCRAEIATPVWSTRTFSPSLSTITLAADPELDLKDTGPLRQYDASSNEQQIGLLRVVPEKGTGVSQYIWWDYTVEELNAQGFDYTSYPKRTTVNRNEALVVSFLPSSAPHQISCLNSRGHLGRVVIRHNSNLQCYALYGCNNQHDTGKPVASGSVLVPKVWNFLEDGTLQASLSLFSEGSHKETKFTTTEVHVDTSGSMMRFVKPGTPLEQDRPKGNPVHPFVRTRIVFEPL